MTELPGKLACIFASLLVSSALFAQENDPPPGEQGLSTAERLEILEGELERVQLERATRTHESVHGMGPSASAVYHESEGLTWGGYGEVKYRDYRSSFKADEADVHRFVLYAGYRFNDWIVLNTELEYEHAGFESETVRNSAGTGTTSINSSEVFVEFAYLDFEFARPFQLAVGLNLIPVGITNYMHEPTTFLAVERSRTESDIIPSTWREIGAIFHGEFGDLVTWRAGVLNGPRGTEFSESSWIRGGRTKGSKARAEGLAYVASLDLHPLEGMTLGGSYYRGDSGQGEISKVTWTGRLLNPLDSASDPTGLLTTARTIQANRLKTARVRVHIAEGHFMYNSGPFLMHALFARGWMNEDDTRAVNSSTGNNIGQVVEGGYVEAGFNVLSFFDTSHRLYPFFRYEYLNTQKETVRRYAGGEEDLNDALCSGILVGTCKVTGSTATATTLTNQDQGVIEGSLANESYGIRGVANRVNDRRIATFGVAYFPDPLVVIKAEYERWSSASTLHSDIEGLNSSNNKIDRVQVAVGFIF
ncbi:MAG: hypothetical protein H7A21_06510 [Spirochaetales bacterium]|nr:hypothetical protein [Leptospiraceae bacterium]MCP5481065.1 hypothetical protein [Spirochaetales bacterium]MCP5485445.1 hypothetical protein [Spirochaetales bacterium]